MIFVLNYKFLVNETDENRKLDRKINHICCISDKKLRKNK